MSISARYVGHPLSTYPPIPSSTLSLAAPSPRTTVAEYFYSRFLFAGINAHAVGTMARESLQSCNNYVTKRAKKEEEMYSL